MFPKLLMAAALVPVALMVADAQEKPAGCVQWKSYTDTVWVVQDITENRVVNETSYETKEVTKSRPRWISEELERTVTEEKPVKQTSERIVTRTVRKPVTTKKTRIKTRVEESYENVTEMHDETYTVRKPVVETVMKKEEVRVRKPVTKRILKKEEVTVYCPKETTQTTMVPGTLLVPGVAGSSRPRMRWLERGYYSDPYNGQPVWRRSGLHWVDEPRYGQAAVPVVVPQQQSAMTLVPETIVEEKPVEVTTFVDEYETRQVPVEVERIVEETRTRKVPRTVRIPKRKLIEEEIPYTETTYVDETITERVPYTETVMKKVTRKEPYTRIKETWEDYTETVRVPKTTTKRVPYVAKYRVPYYVQVRVPCDANGRPVARGQQVPGTHRLHPAWKKMMTKVVGATESVKTDETSVFEKTELSPAQFNVPDAVDVPDSAKSVLAGQVRNESSGLGDAPRVKFRNFATGERVETTSMKPIVKAKPDPVVPPAREETEASKQLAKEIDDGFRALGMVAEDERPESESVESDETSAKASDSADPEDRAMDIDPVLAKAAFTPEPLTIDVEVPPSAAQPTAVEPDSDEADAENEDDDTIEQDVDVSRPARS